MKRLRRMLINKLVEYGLIVGFCIGMIYVMCICYSIYKCNKNMHEETEIIYVDEDWRQVNDYNESI